MIRERGHPGYLRLSIGFHAAALVAASWLDLLLVPAFGLLVARAVILPGRRLRPAQVGTIEIGCSLLVLTLLLVAF